jgi:cell shape-determining protein MreC
VKEFFKSKFFYVITVLTLIAVIVPTVLVSMGLTPVLRSAVNTVLLPIQKLSDKAAGVIDGYASYFRAFDKMKAENAKLKEELASLREQIYEAKEMKEKYEWMSEFLELKMNHMDYHTVPASITGRGSSDYAGVFMLDAGTKEGLPDGAEARVGFQGDVDGGARVEDAFVDDGHTAQGVVDGVVHILDELPAACGDGDRALSHIHGVEAYFAARL